MKFAFNITKQGKKQKLYIYEYLPEANAWVQWIGLNYVCTTYQTLFNNYINKLIVKYYWYKHITIPDIITDTTNTIFKQLYETSRTLPIQNNKSFNQSKMLIEIIYDIITEPEFCNIFKREKIQVADQVFNVYSFDNSI